MLEKEKTKKEKIDLNLGEIVQIFDICISIYSKKEAGWTTKRKLVAMLAPY